MSERKRARKGDANVRYRTLASGKVVWDVTYSWRDATGRRKQSTKRGFPNQTAARDWGRAKVVEIKRNGLTHQEPSRQRLAAFLSEYMEGKSLTVQTRAGYERKIRLHVNPHIGHLPLSSVEPSRLNALYRKLERAGSPGGNGPLSRKSVAEIHAILSGAFKAALR